MRNFVIGIAAILLMCGTALAADAPQPAKPEKEHEWLKQIVGEWETDAECSAPGQPPMKMRGSDSARMVGGHWLVCDGKMNVGEATMNSLFTLGYDPANKKYVGTWIDSMANYMWHYVGTVDASGKVLTLETEGPNPLTGKKSKFKEVLTIKDKDHKSFTSNIQGDDGTWVKFLTIESTRKK